MGGVFLVLVGALEIVAPDCPSAEAIAAHWATLGVEPPVGQAEVAVEGDHLHLTLRSSDGKLRADRRLRAPADCEERAAIAAVVLAAWSPPPLPIAPAAPVAHAEDPPDPPEPSQIRRRLPPRRATLEVTASFVGAIDPSGFAPGASAELAIAPRKQTAWWAFLSLSGGGLRSISLGEGSARYTRIYATLGPRRRFSDGGWRIDLELDASLALVYLTGSGFANNEEALAFDFGLGAGLRVGRRFGAWTPFLAARVIGWVTRQKVDATGGSGELPRVDGLLSAGIAFDR